MRGCRVVDGMIRLGVSLRVVGALVVVVVVVGGSVVVVVVVVVLARVVGGVVVTFTSVASIASFPRQDAFHGSNDSALSFFTGLRIHSITWWLVTR